MNEKKLTDEEIVKALECMANSLSGTSGYTVDIIPYSIDLIHRLQGENKQLKCDSYRTSWKAKFLEAKKEIERLTEEKWNVQDDLDNYHILLREKEKQVDELTKQREVGREKLKNEIANKIFMSASHGAIQCGKMSVAIAEIEAEKYVEFAWEMVQQAVKDTAKEIYELIDAVKEVFPNDYRGYDMAHGWSMCVDKLKEIIKSKGAEVE